jgi:hypothetical protein
MTDLTDQGQDTARVDCNEKSLTTLTELTNAGPWTATVRALAGEPPPAPPPLQGRVHRCLGPAPGLHDDTDDEVAA